MGRFRGYLTKVVEKYMLEDNQRSKTLQECFAEFRQGRITKRTANEIRRQALKALDVQGDGYEAVEKALTIAFAQKRPRRRSTTR